MENVVLNLIGIDCPSCSKKIENVLNKKFGDKVEATFNMTNLSLDVDYDPSISVKEIQDAIKAAGFGSEIAE